MIYDFAPLEFKEFKNYLKNNYSSHFSIEAADNLVPLEDSEAIYTVQREIEEAIRLAEKGKFIENDDEFSLVYKKLKKENPTFEPLDFIAICKFLEKLDILQSKLLECKVKYLSDKANSLNSLPILREGIRKAIDDSGEIKDDATETLKGVRYGLREFRNKIRKILNETLNSPNANKFVQEDVVVLRGGRYTIPCKTNFGQYIQGIIHDKSASGQTLYIEPSSCVTMNNSMQELIIGESEEIAKILYDLSSRLKYSLDDIENNVDTYKFLAFRLETGYFYSNKPYCFAEIAEYVKLDKIHHPLLYLRKKDVSIPIDFDLEQGIKTAVITGANTGGKTAALKSIGLNHLITFCGLPVFASSAKCVLFSSIFADIGDNQSLVMDLSTFSSHMLNIKRIVENVGSNSLVLLDELGTGTEPREGASLAVAILQKIESCGGRCVVTTHFSELKNYALHSPEAIFYAVDFNYDDFSPRYKLLKNILGKSDPIMIAKRLGFGSDIINMANAELSKYKSGVEMRLEELNRMTAEAEHERRLLHARLKELENREKDNSQKEENLKKRLNSKELELLEETYSLLQKSKRLAAEKLKTSPEEIHKDMVVTAEKIEKIKSTRKAVSNIVAGDLIYLERYNKTAKVLSVDGETLNLNMEGMRVKLNKNEAVGHKVKDKPQTVKISSGGVSGGSRREMLLIGKRVEEAQDMLDKFIDESLLAGYDKVYIIHGRGSGQLRKGVHDYLRTAPRIKKYYLAGNDEGGNATTIVEF